ncbi:MAG: cysteine-rich CWC family protein [Chitinophagaceae bacterium]
MCRHEEKKCSRCGKPFECKVGNVTQCHCSNIDLTDEQRSFIAQRYQDCLCHQCLLDLKQGYVLFKEKFLQHGR